MCTLHARRVSSEGLQEVWHWGKVPCCLAYGPQQLCPAATGSLCATKVVINVCAGCCLINHRYP